MKKCNKMQQRKFVMNINRNIIWLCIFPLITLQHIQAGNVMCHCLTILWSEKEKRKKIKEEEKNKKRDRGSEGKERSNKSERRT